MVTLPAEGRVFTHRDRVTLADVSPSGRARLDALARWLQDAAYDDALDSGLDGGAWIVRRLALRVRALPAAAASRSRSRRSAAARRRCGRSGPAS